MGRRKVKNELIPDQSTRKVTFKKRKAGLMKKMKELTTLCGINACAIIFSSHSSKPDVWPSPTEAFHVLNDFKNLPKRKQGKYMMDQEELLVKMVSKLNENFEKQMAKNKMLEMALVSEKFMEDEMHDLNDLGNLESKILLLEEQIRFIDDKIRSECEEISADEK